MIQFWESSACNRTTILGMHTDMDTHTQTHITNTYSCKTGIILSWCGWTSSDASQSRLLLSIPLSIILSLSLLSSFLSLSILYCETALSQTFQPSFKEPAGSNKSTHAHTYAHRLRELATTSPPHWLLTQGPLRGVSSVLCCTPCSPTAWLCTTPTPSSSLLKTPNL